MIAVMPNTGLAIELQPAERTQLEQWESAHGAPQQVALRCRIILRAVAGQQNVAIAEGLGVSRPAVQLWRIFQLSRDAKFLEKLSDVVGLYMNPPDKALVLCLDEKSQIQALDRTQPGAAVEERPVRYDDARLYKRNGTTTLFAALNVLDGKVIGECHGRHRHQEWRKFLHRLDAEFPGELKLNVVMANYGTHKEPHVQAWLKQHPRFVCHFVPTS